MYRIDRVPVSDSTAVGHGDNSRHVRRPVPGRRRHSASRVHGTADRGTRVGLNRTRCTGTST